MPGREHRAPQHTPARTGGKGLSPPPGDQQDRCRRAAAEPHRCRGKGRVCGAERAPVKAAKASAGFSCPRQQRAASTMAQAAAPRQRGRSAARPAPPPRQKRPAGCQNRAFQAEALQRIAEAARQQGICPAEEHQREACPAGPQRKAGTSQHQRPAPGQKCRTKPAGPEPSAATAAPRRRAGRGCPVKTPRTRGTGCSAQLRLRRRQSSPQAGPMSAPVKGKQGPVENGPAPASPSAKAPPCRRAGRTAAREANAAATGCFGCSFVVSGMKKPAFRRGSFQCSFPALCIYCSAGARRFMGSCGKRLKSAEIAHFTKEIHPFGNHFIASCFDNGHDVSQNTGGMLELLWHR